MGLGRRGPGLVGVAARTAVFAGVSGPVAHRQHCRWADGIISEAEFQAKKKQILGI
jgi:hypothetical protein